MGHMKFQAKIHVILKPTVNAPQGLTIKGGLQQLGFQGVESVRSGKYFEISIQAEDESDAKVLVDGMCEKLLANPVIENYEFTVSKSNS